MNEEKNINNHQFTKKEDGFLEVISPDYLIRILYPDEVKAFRTYFQEERDTELNRWRDPENPDMICYAVSDKTQVDVCVLDERTGTTGFYGLNNTTLRVFGSMGRTAIGYFEAHPPKNLWEDAKEGEYWLVTWTHIHTPDPCVVVSVDNDLYFQGRRQARDTSSEYIRHAQKLVVEED